MPDEVVCNDATKLEAEWHAKTEAYQNDDAETTRREQQVDPGFYLGHLDVKPWGYHAGLVETAVQLNNDLA